MSRGIKILIGIVGTLLSVFLIGVVLCKLVFDPVGSTGPESGAEGSTADSVAWQPFSVDMTGGDGARVSWQGYSDGYQPGTAQTMHLAIDNHTDQAWNGRFCVQLLEPMPSSVVTPLADQEFSLESDAGFVQDVQVELPANVRLGIRGLALVVHEPAGSIVNVIPVQVAEGEGEPFHGDWPIQAALGACPLPQSASGGPAGD